MTQPKPLNDASLDEVSGGFFSGGGGGVGFTRGEVIRGTENNNYLRGGNGDDVISGLGGNDWLMGDRGNDSLNGGDGNDTVVWQSGDGRDQIWGGAGQDVLEIDHAGLSWKDIQVVVEPGSTGQPVPRADGTLDVTGVKGELRFIDADGKPASISFQGMEEIRLPERALQNVDAADLTWNAGDGNRVMVGGPATDTLHVNLPGLDWDSAGVQALPGSTGQITFDAANRTLNVEGVSGLLSFRDAAGQMVEIRFAGVSSIRLG